MRVPNWFRVDAAGLRYYTAWNFFASGVVDCAFSTRIGGTSRYGGLNLSLAVHDDAQDVIGNRRAFADALGVEFSRIVVPDQVHSTVVRRVTESDAGSGSTDHLTAISDTDALITNTPGLPLVLHFADCACIFFLDTQNRAIGVAHAGWRGTVNGIALLTVEAMKREFGSDPCQMLAAVGPSIGRHCYEVGEEVAREFSAAFCNDERVISQSSKNKWRVDLKTANVIMIQRAGLDQNNVAISEECTRCNRDEFFSYRRDGDTGRMSGWLALRHV